MELKYVVDEVIVEFEWFQKITNKRLPNGNWHGHGNIEMHFVKQGELLFELGNGMEMTVRDGEAIIIPPQLQHRLSNPSGKKYVRFVLNVAITNNSELLQNKWANRFIDISNPRKVVCGDDIFSLLNECSEEARSGKTWFMSIIEVNTFKILVLLSRKLPGKDDEMPSQKPSKRSLDSIRMQKIIEYIESAYDRRLTVGDIAAQIPLCSKQLQRIVRSECNMTVNELCQKVKLQKAKELLKDSNLTFSQIAEQLGFESGQSFSRFFKRTEGQSPKLYRSAILPIDSNSLKTAAEKGKSCRKCMK